MQWSTNEYLVLATGILFLAVVVASAMPSVSLTRASRATFGFAALVFIGASFALAWVAAVQYPPVMWVLPVVPLLIMGVLVRDAVVMRRASSHLPERATAVARPEDREHLAVSSDPPAKRTRVAGGGEGRAGEAAAYQPA